jgi:hypothetical protein
MFFRIHFRLTIVSLLLLSCNNRADNNGRSTSQRGTPKTGNSNKENTSSIRSADQKIGKATYYLENSESMFGYVSGLTEYVSVVSELAEKPDFVNENTRREFYLINGGQPVTPTYIGNNPSVLKSNLNTSGFKKGDVTKSNLNLMFQTALSQAGGNNISILISDCIYDIGDKSNPLISLEIEGKATRSLFIQRLNTGNVQTIIIKLQSNFNGKYFYTSKPGKLTINQKRPYYILIFGESGILNKYFSQNYIEKLKGYESMARFLKIDNINIPYQAGLPEKGTFRPDRNTKNRLNDATPDRNGQGFQFSIACDFSSLPFSESYLTTKENYSATNNSFMVLGINKPSKRIYGIPFTPTHLITVFTPKSPYGNLEIKLKNVIPKWIDNSDTNTETNIQNDNTHTFGLKFLTEAISEAYDYKNKEKDIVSFKFEILK